MTHSLVQRCDHLYIKRTTSNFDTYKHTILKDEPCPEVGLETDVSKLAFQGLETMHTGSVAEESKYQNVKFSDQAGDYSLTIGNTIDPTRKMQDTSDANLEHFFRRPIKILETEWGTSGILSEEIDPWTLYFENVRVINRITNYKLLRCKLKLKIVINGNSFHYGRAYAAYHPLSIYDGMTMNRAGVFSDNVNLSQLPKIFLDPTLSQGGEMELPFFWYHNYLSITDSEWDQMGTLIIRSLTPLKHANGATDQVTISVFAWAEDVELSVLTSVESSTLSPQGGDETDHAQGRISAPATAISKAAHALTNVPGIGPFAMATSVAADTVSGVAKAFGYSRPLIDSTAEAYVNRPMGTLAQTNARDGSVKLTVDAKQELSIDPRIVGLDEKDQMTIKSIASRESFLTQFTWPVGTGPETLLWNGRVDPCQFVEQGTPTEYHLTPSCIAALPFQYWTGTMKFRFQIVASAFHRGRIKIVYDPDFLASNEYNTNYTNIIDIAESRDFTIEIGNGQERTLLGHHFPGPDSETQMFGTSVFSAKEEGNGVVGVYVVNELSVPNSAVNNDIMINVFVSMGDDFEVFVPTNQYQYLRPGLGSQPLGFQGGEEFPDAQETSEPSAPFQVQSEQLGLGTQDNALINKVYSGEAITSFRQMLKRYDYFRTNPMVGRDTDVSAHVLRYRQSMYPFYPGYVSGAVDLTLVNDAYNYCSMTLWHWTAMCFAGVRGGMRYKAVARCITGGGSNAAILETERLNGQVPYSREVVSRIAPTSVSLANFYAQRGREVARGNLGKNVVFTRINPVNEVELPFYSSRRFFPHRQLDWTSGDQGVGGFQTQLEVQAATAYTGFDLYFSTAEDFGLHFWICPPPLLYTTNANLPTPSPAI